MAFESLQKALQKREQAGLMRKHHQVQFSKRQFVQIDGKQYLNFASNDYLGLAQHRFDDAELLSEPSGSGASPLVTGFSSQHAELTKYVADAYGRDDALLFSTGFSANSAIVQALMQDGGRVIADKLSHASIIDGGLASGVEFTRFKHNDLAHLGSKLESNCENTLVVTEGIFSMDGDAAPIADIAKLCKDSDSWLMVDDAHGIGVFGDTGLGISEQQNLTQSELPVLMGTFGKAIGSSGAFVVGSQSLIDYLRNFARHYVYSTAMSPLQAAITLKKLKKCREESWRREKLQENIKYFKRLATNSGIQLLSSDSAIQPVVVGDPLKVVAQAEQLKNKGFWVAAIRTPTVPKNTDRLRITLTSLHETVDIQRLVQALAEVQATQ